MKLPPDQTAVFSAANLLSPAGMIVAKYSWKRSGCSLSAVRRRAHGAHGARDAGYPVEAVGADASRRPGPGSARIPGRDIASTFTSRDAGATGNPARHWQS